MHTLTVKLKQHTPLIHFQHDQEGATLRASEVKPKLDRFILSKLSPAEIEKGKKEKWIKTKNDRVWLDYKMRIVIDEQSTRQDFLLASYIRDNIINQLNTEGINAIGSTPYFAQEKQNGEIINSRNLERRKKWDQIEKRGIIESGSVFITIIWPGENTSWVKFIQSFFLTTNFGTRQSKGFGSFEAVNIKLDDLDVPLNSTEDLLKNNYLFVYKKSVRTPDLTLIFKTINDDYKLLKSGSTYPRYAKSKLLLYAENINKNIGWDKKYIKVNTEGVFASEENGDPYILKCKEEHKRSSYSTKQSYRFYRAMLGLAEQFEFLLENPPRGHSRNKMIVKIKNEDVQRYQSPILFKVIGKDIYLVGNQVPVEMLNIPFEFLVNFQNDEGYENEPIDENNPIRTPEKFSLKDFMSFAMNDVSLGYTKIKG